MKKDRVSAFLRGREFIMKDAYSFDKDEAGLRFPIKKCMMRTTMCLRAAV